MHAVVKGTKSVEEFKKMKSFLEEKAKEYFAIHKSNFENWTEGEIEKVWIDGQGNLCIEYESGNWWHYNEKGEWW